MATFANRYQYWIIYSREGVMAYEQRIGGGAAEERCSELYRQGCKVHCVVNGYQLAQRGYPGMDGKEAHMKIRHDETDFEDEVAQQDDFHKKADTAAKWG